MTLPLFLFDPLPAAGGTVELAGEEGRHAVVVKRLRVGESLLLSDGQGRVATAEIVEVAKASLTARVMVLTESAPPRPRLTVVQAIAKGERSELAVEMLTEIGADVVVPWGASRCVVQWRGDRADKSLSRWRRTAREAAKQARRAWQLEVTEQATTRQVAELLAQADVGIVLHEDATVALGEVPLEAAGSVVIVVGPEGGLSPEELDAFHEAHIVGLGNEVLRTSTAGVAAAAAVLSRTSRWRAP